MRRRLLLRVAASDLAGLVAALAVGSAWTFGTPALWNADVPPGQSAMPLTGLLVGGFFLGTFLTGRAWIKGPPRPAYGRALSIAGFMLGVTSLGIVFARVYWSRSLLVITTVVWIVLALAMRALYRQQAWADSLVVVTDESALVSRLQEAPHAAVLARVSPKTVDAVDEIPQDATLVVDLRAVLSDRMAQFVSSCNLAGVPVRTLGDVYEEHTGRFPIVHLAEGWELSVPVQRAAGYEPLKRLLDVVAVVVMAPIAIVLSAVAWVLVRVDAGQPVLFRQRRVGRNGEPFIVYKFRTMQIDAEAEGPRFAVERDDRVTRIGRFLRKSRIDELPQLWNILRGDLSLVGPRPEQEAFVAAFAEKIPFYMHRHLVRPGLTGWSQVNYGYGGAEDTEDKLAYDLYYAKHMSIWLDAQIIGKTIWTVVSGSGAR
ncbi:MAG: sugar transferase [Acidimicrobiia bacterium]|nr:sugar transferase [Acidimicrobiia bacterium]